MHPHPLPPSSSHTTSLVCTLRLGNTRVCSLHTLQLQPRTKTLRHALDLVDMISDFPMGGAPGGRIDQDRPSSFLSDDDGTKKEKSWNCSSLLLFSLDRFYFLFLFYFFWYNKLMGGSGARGEFEFPIMEMRVDTCTGVISRGDECREWFAVTDLILKVWKKFPNL